MIYASPKSIVQKEISLAISQHEKEINKWGERRQSLQAHLEKTKAKLNAEEASFAAEYEELRPKQGDQDVLALRNPLKELSKARASKSIADEWYQKTLTERIEPLKDEIAKTEHAIADTWSNESKVQAGFRDRVFSAVNGVSNSNKKRWKTGKDGFVSVEVPAAEPWTVWAVAEHEKYLGKNIVWNSTSQVTRSGNSSSSGTIESTDIVQKKQVRWLLDIPEELDENKLLSLDLETALDSQVLSIESSNNGSCLRKRRASE